MRVFIYGLFLILPALLVIGWYYAKSKPVEEAAVVIKEKTAEFTQKIVEPEPVPFEEITIPYLRKRTYQSSIGELKQLSTNQRYTSYLTSYDSDGFKINAQLTKPKGEMPDGGWPAIIFIHGYIPPATYKTTSNYASYVDYLARNGFVVFKIDLRGHGTSEGEPGGGYYGSDYVVDALNAYSALQKADFVNANKIGMWGHSMAGNIVMRSVAVKKDIPAVVIWAGAVYTYQDMRDYGIDDNSYRPPSEQSESRRKRNELMETHGQFSQESEFWKTVVPTNYLDGVTTAIQVNHAVNDNVVSIDYSRNLMSILDKTTIHHELKELPSGGHNISGANYNVAMNNTVEFFRKNF